MTSHIALILADTDRLDQALFKGTKTTSWVPYYGESMGIATTPSGMICYKRRWLEKV